jgi:predicted O-methyltransferase YrrM
VIDFAAIKRECDGMMRPDVYASIHEAALTAPDGLFVEIGTAHGASSVCLGLAAKASGINVRTFDSFRKGGRSNYGDAEKNEAIARANIDRFGLADTVTVHKCEVAQVPGYLDDTPISLLMLDCDGQIDRDIAALFDKLAPSASIIIDDCAPRSRVKDRGDGTCRIDQKHLLTWLLTESLTRAGVLVRTGGAYQTWFGRKGDAEFLAWSMDERLAAYRGLVFADGELRRG